MPDINYQEVKTYFVATGPDCFSYGEINPDQCMSTGLPNVEVFDNEEDYKNRLLELEVSP